MLPAPVFPEQWDASLDTFPAALQQLANQDAAAAEGVRQKFEEAKQAVLVPQHSHVLHWHAIRLLLQQAVDQMDTTADTVKQVVSDKLALVRMAISLLKRTLDSHPKALCCSER